jgi:hypothetical protein
MQRAFGAAGAQGVPVAMGRFGGLGAVRGTLPVKLPREYPFTWWVAVGSS